MASPLPRGSGHAGACRRAAGEGHAPGDAVGDARRPEDRERRADPHRALHAVPTENRRAGQSGPDGQGAGPRAGRPALSNRAAACHRLLPGSPTANPFDLDAEKALAFATAREIRMLLLAPSKIAERLDEMYRPEKAVDKLLEGMESSAALEHLKG